MFNRTVSMFIYRVFVVLLCCGFYQSSLSAKSETLSKVGLTALLVGGLGGGTLLGYRSKLKAQLDALELNKDINPAVLGLVRKKIRRTDRLLILDGVISAFGGFGLLMKRKKSSNNDVAGIQLSPLPSDTLMDGPTQIENPKLDEIVVDTRDPVVPLLLSGGSGNNATKISHGQTDSLRDAAWSDICLNPVPFKTLGGWSGTGLTDCPSLQPQNYDLCEVVLVALKREYPMRLDLFAALIIRGQRVFFAKSGGKGIFFSV